MYQQDTLIFFLFFNKNIKSGSDFFPCFVYYMKRIKILGGDVQITDKKKITICVFLIFTLMIGIAGYLVYSRDQKEIAYTTADGCIYYTDGTMKPGEGVVNRRLDDLDHNIYNSDRTGDIVDGTFSAILKHQQNLPGICEYVFILMVDFKQVEFEVEGVSYRNYRFSLEGEDECQIKFKLTDLPEDAHEMEYLIFYDPDCMDLSFTEEGEENISKTEIVYAGGLTFTSSSGHPDDLKYIKGKQFPLGEDEYFDGASLYRYKDPSYILPEAVSGEKVYFFIGSYDEEEAEYSTVAFCNWEQTNLFPGEESFYTKIPAYEMDYYEFNLPEVEKDSPYQIVVFNRPYEDTAYYSISSSSTTRTIIRQKSE